MSIERQIIKGKSVTLHWVKAHVGHTLNEEADYVAKLGTVDEQYEQVPIPWCLIKTRIREKTITAWGNRWGKSLTCRQTKLFVPSPQTRVSAFVQNASREDVGLLVQFITGHNFLRYHLFNTGRAASADCRLCAEHTPETSWHLWTECPALCSTWAVTRTLPTSLAFSPRRYLTFGKESIARIFRPTDQIV